MTTTQVSWWDAAPLRATGGRALSRLPAAVLQNLVEEGKALARHAIRKQLRALEGLLGDADDLDQQLATWILEAAATYDPARGPWDAHLVQRVRQQAVDQWRASVGRMAIETLKRARSGGCAALTHTELLHTNRIRSLLPGGQSWLDPHTDQTPYLDEELERIEDRSAQAQLTAALLRAATADRISRPHRPRALASCLLQHLHGHSRRRLAACGIHHRTIAKLEDELHHHVRHLLQER